MSITLRPRLGGLWKHKRKFLAGLIIFFVSISLYSYICFKQPSMLGLFQDDGFYYGAAETLAEGKGYRIPYFPNEPFLPKYPPLYPVVLAIFIKLGIIVKHKVHLAALPSIIFLSASGVLIHDLLRKRFSTLKVWQSASLTFLFLFHPEYWEYIRFTLSEMQYMFFFTLFLWLFEIFSKRKHQSLWNWFWLGTVIGMASLTRAIGISFVMGIIFWLFCHNYNKKMTLIKKVTVFAIPAIIPYLAWILYVNWQFNHDPSLIELTQYTLFNYNIAYSNTSSQLLSHLPLVIFFNSIYLATDICNIFGFFGKMEINIETHLIFRLTFLLIIISVFTLGIYNAIKSRGSRPEYFMVFFYMFLVLIWPWFPRRFLVVLLPWIFLVTADFVSFVHRKRKIPSFFVFYFIGLLWIIRSRFLF